MSTRDRYDFDVVFQLGNEDEQTEVILGCMYLLRQKLAHGDVGRSEKLVLRGTTNLTSAGIRSKMVNPKCHGG